MTSGRVLVPRILGDYYAKRDRIAIAEEGGGWIEHPEPGVVKPDLYCPGCGRSGHLGGHEIRPDGAVSPSVVCPFECGFHAFVILDGWPGRFLRAENGP